MTMVFYGSPWPWLTLVDFGWLWEGKVTMVDRGCLSPLLTVVDHDHGLTGWSRFIMVNHAHAWPLLTMWIWLWSAMLIMLNQSLLHHYCIATLIMFCSSHCDIRFSLSHCDINFCSSHDIGGLWSSNYDRGFLFVILWCWNRFIIVRQWVMFVTLQRREMLISLECCIGKWVETERRRTDFPP
jgi:hypothetical protein